MAIRIGMDVGGTKTEGVAVDAQGTILARLRRPTQWGPDAVIAGIVETTRALAAEAGFAASDIASVGVGVPGRGRHRGACAARGEPRGGIA